MRNITARLPGKPGHDALFIVSHYDSVETGLGAGDSAEAIAGILETVRVLRNSAPPVQALRVTNGMMMVKEYGF